MAKLKNILERRTLAHNYKVNYGISIEATEVERLTEKQLLIKLETKYHIIKEEKAAIVIQSMGRFMICRNLFSRMM